MLHLALFFLCRSFVIDRTDPAWYADKATSRLDIIVNTEIRTQGSCKQRNITHVICSHTQDFRNKNIFEYPSVDSENFCTN